MASSETSYSATRLFVLLKSTKDKDSGKMVETREIVEHLTVSPKGPKGNALVGAKQLIADYREMGWDVEVLDKQLPEVGLSVGRFYLKASRKIGRETIELYFTSFVGRDASTRCETCSATFDFGRKDFCPNCQKLTKVELPDVELE